MNPNAILVIPRIFLGVAFLLTDIFKILNPTAFRQQMIDLLNRWPSFGWYKSFALSTVIPHAGAFSVLIMAAELYVGIAMLLGLTTRLAAVVALFLVINYLCAKGSMPWNPSSVDASDIILCLVVLIGAAGRTFGIDSFLYKRYPNVPVW
ncbi:MAG TPA: TQO small subunit DoxD [Blastocatellia bacterium]|nr:TQO small subunit DoxD [Blastocatellia bacterium]